MRRLRSWASPIVLGQPDAIAGIASSVAAFRRVVDGIMADAHGPKPGDFVHVDAEGVAHLVRADGALVMSAAPHALAALRPDLVEPLHDV